jgi:4-oxalocrotonate tautomerase
VINMPIVNIQIAEGRTVEQKRALVEGVTKVVNETTGAPCENITILIEDVPLTNVAKAGVLFCDIKK